jgi:threonine dehydratase
LRPTRPQFPVSGFRFPVSGFRFPPTQLNRIVKLPSLQEIETAAQVVYRAMPATPQYRWALSSQRIGTHCWFKHENHTPVGAFKIRGGLTFFDDLHQRGELPRAVISATRGNHGQSVAWSARSHAVACTIVVPHGNSVEKNASMRALGAELIEYGDDFQASREHALTLAAQSGALMVPSFGFSLVRGVATYWWEFFKAVPQLDVVYVPIGLGSGICAAIAAKLALQHPVRIVGVVSSHATSYADSMATGCVVASPVSTVLADGMACRIAEQEALDTLLPHVDHIVQVSDEAVGQAMRDIFKDTHNIAEGAGAAGFAAAMQEREANRGMVVGTTVSGGNVDSSMLARVLAGANA